ncbi:unnamed protein product [Tuber aestivum]|uniref:Uncharacterized protein n=1 Tax=Tuber aestivum TaxID=59557 RepID=A0A292PPS2_9PEZI|nr:unnamed protein product [Tuber aestivum]
MAKPHPNYAALAQHLKNLANEVVSFPNIISFGKEPKIRELVAKIREDAQVLEEDVRLLSRLIRENIERNEARLRAIEGQDQASGGDNDELSQHLSSVSLSESAEAGHPTNFDGVIAQGTDSSPEWVTEGI